jgi:PAS domain-containing protein
LRAKGRATPFEKEYVRKDGARRWALFAAHLIGEGEAVEYIVDVTEAKEAERKLHEIEDKYKNLLAARAEN